MWEATYIGGLSILSLAFIGFILLCLAWLLEKTAGIDSKWLDYVVEFSGV